jgi:hypothetical protein
LNRLLPGYSTPNRYLNSAECVSPDDLTRTQPGLHSWMLLPTHSLSRIPAWRSRTHWLQALAVALAMPDGQAILRHEQTSYRSVLCVARVDAFSADHRTGRSVATSHHTVAIRTRLSAGTVQKARRVLSRAGFMHTVAPGRYLTSQERVEAQNHHGGRQIRAASTRALSLPASAAGYHSGHLSRRDKSVYRRSVGINYPTRASAREAATRPEQKRSHEVLPPVPLAVQFFAAKLRHRLGWLKGDFHMLGIARILIAEGIDVSQWTVENFVRAIDTAAARNGGFPDWGSIRRPLAYLRFWVQQLDEPKASNRSVDHTQHRPQAAIAPRNPHRTPPTPEYFALKAKLAAERQSRSDKKITSLSSNSQ